MRQATVDLLSFGMYVVTVELLDTETDAYSRRIVRNVASLGGVEPLPNAEYMRRTFITDLVLQLDIGDDDEADPDMPSDPIQRDYYVHGWKD